MKRKLNILSEQNRELTEQNRLLTKRVENLEKKMEDIVSNSDKNKPAVVVPLHIRVSLNIHVCILFMVGKCQIYEGLCVCPWMSIEIQIKHINTFKCS